MNLYFYPVGGDGYAAVIAVAAVLLLLLILGPARGKLRRGQRAVLLALRLGVILLLLAAMLRPALVYTAMARRQATLAILLDKSRSMTVRDCFDGQSRWEAMRAALDAAAGELAQLAKDFELKAWSFDGRLHTLNVANGKVELAGQPDGDETALGWIMDRAVQDLAGKRVLGMILLSDGRQRTLAHDDLPQTAAAAMKRLDWKLYTVRLGEPRSLGQSPDAALTELNAPGEVFEKNELAVSGKLKIEGLADQKIAVRLLVEEPPRADGGPRKMLRADEKFFTTSRGAETLPVEFAYFPQTPGEYKLTLEAAVGPNEQLSTNNRLSTYFNVLKGGLRVLYVEGALRVEQTFLRRSLAGTEEIHVDTVRLDPRRGESRPADLAGRFKPGKYDVYILGDVHASQFQGSELADLAAAVEQGAGLVMVGGLHNFGPGQYAQSPLAKVLPVVMDRLEGQPIDSPPAGDLQLPAVRMLPTPQSGRTLMLAATAEENRALWSKLPKLDGANKFQALAPDAVVLAAGENQESLLVAREAGRGRALAFAGDSTWRWVMEGFADAHRRFWRQLVLWLARKDDTAGRNVWVRMPQRRFSPGDQVAATFGARAPSGDPLPDAVFDVTVLKPDGSVKAVDVLRAGEQGSLSYWDTVQPEDYTLRVKATHNGRPLGEATARFYVRPQNLEMDNTTADTALDTLPAITGGQAVRPTELPELVQRLRQQTEVFEKEKEQSVTPFRGKPPEDSEGLMTALLSGYFALAVCLLGAEWYLRKRWGLV